MWSRAITGVLIGLGLLLTFGAAVAFFLRLLPGPHTRTDYLVVGSAATFLVLLVLFFAIVFVSLRATGGVFGRRKR